MVGPYDNKLFEKLHQRLLSKKNAMVRRMPHERWNDLAKAWLRRNLCQKSIQKPKWNLSKSPSSTSVTWFASFDVMYLFTLEAQIRNEEQVCSVASSSVTWKGEIFMFWSFYITMITIMKFCFLWTNPSTAAIRNETLNFTDIMMSPRPPIILPAPYSGWTLGHFSHWFVVKNCIAC